MGQTLREVLASGVRRPLIFPVMRHASSWILLWVAALLTYSWAMNSDGQRLAILAVMAGFLLVPPFAGWLLYRAVWCAIQARWG